MLTTLFAVARFAALADQALRLRSEVAWVDTWLAATARGEDPARAEVAAAAAVRQAEGNASAALGCAIAQGMDPDLAEALLNRYLDQ